MIASYCSNQGFRTNSGVEDIDTIPTQISLNTKLFWFFDMFISEFV